MPRHPEIGEREQCVQLRRVLHQPSVAHLHKPELALDHTKRVLHLGSDARLHMLKLVHNRAHGRTFVQRFALARAHGHVPVGLDALRLFALGHTLVARVGEHIGFFTVHQRAGLRHVIDVGRCAHHCMNQTRVGVYADVCFHSEVPLVALLHLVHLRVTLASGVLGRAGCRNQGGVDSCAALEQQALGGQRAVDSSQYLNAELVLFEQVAKAQNAHAIRNALGAGEAREVAVQRRLEQSLFHGQVRQAEPLLQKMNAQHGLVRKGRTPRAGYRRGRCDQRDEFAPRHHQLHLVQEHGLARAPRAQIQSQFGLFLHDLIVLLHQPSRHWGRHGVLNTILRTHRDPNEIDFNLIWETGLFVFDSSVLLDLYRLPESASNDLIGVLRDEQLRERIWIGFQVIVEFLNNRYEAISDQKNKFNTVRGLLEEASNQYDEVFEKLSEELNKLKLKQRHSLIDPDKFITASHIAEGKSTIDNFLQELSILESKQSDVNDQDQIKNIVVEIFSEKIGEGFEKKELEEIYKIGEKRYEANIPPGYKDKSKQGFYTVENRELIRKYGDLILWKEIIKKANDDGIKSVILVTGDVKEDWWLEKRGKKLGPRKELLNEIYTEAPCVQSFYMYDTASFLKHAKSRLKISVKDSSITQAKDLIDKSRKSRVVAEEGYVFLPEIIKLVASSVDKIRVGTGQSVHSLPPVRLDHANIYRCLLEVFDNAIHHGIHDYIGVQAKEQDDKVVLRFKNRVSINLPVLQEEREKTVLSLARGAGLQHVRELMSKEGVSISTVAAEKHFVLELHIPRFKFFIDATLTVA